MTCGCAPLTPRREPLPRLSEIAPTPPDDAWPERFDPPPRARVLCVHLARPDPPPEAWKLVEPIGLSPSVLARWAANDMRAGTLEPENLEAFHAALMPVLGSKRSVFLGSDHFMPQHTTGPLTGRVPLALTGVKGETSKIELDGGRLRLLIRVRRTDDGNVEVDVAPHHHRRKRTPEPRSPLETVFDGTVFDDLRLRHTGDRLLVLGLPPRPPETKKPPAEPDPATEAKPEAEPDEQVVEPPVSEPLFEPQVIVPTRLGPLLFTTHHRDGPVQVMVILRIESDHRE
ncbi:MAG: hypothetical protein CMJ18_13335 [Phycisphaeraceae bacterium]|nr:hypothetical protein [Phycisphaeraceae bacterium]